MTGVVGKPVREAEVSEDAPTVDSVDGVTPGVATEEKPTVGEPEVPVPEPQKELEGPAQAEGLGPSPEAVKQGVPTLVVSKPTTEPATEDKPAAESESVIEPQEPGPVPPIVSFEGPSPDEAELQAATPAISKSVEAAQEVPTPDVPQEESNEVGRSQSPWTPSYSVSSQGGGLDNLGSADEEVVGSTTTHEPPVEEPIAEPTSAPEIVTPAEVRAFNPLFLPSKIERLLFRSQPLPNRRVNLNRPQRSSRMSLSRQNPNPPPTNQSLKSQLRSCHPLRLVPKFTRFISH